MKQTHLMEMAPGLEDLMETPRRGPVLAGGRRMTGPFHVASKALTCVDAEPANALLRDGSATAALATALTALADQARRTPCQDAIMRALWHGSPSERAVAEQECQACPVLTLCRAYGDEIDERWGVLGGVDRERRVAS